jgi:hypothetical protein
MSKSVIYFYLKFLMQSQTHFLRRYRTKPNTALKSEAAFVHLICIAIRVNENFAFLTVTVNNYFTLLSLPLYLRPFLSIPSLSLSFVYN